MNISNKARLLLAKREQERKQRAADKCKELLALKRERDFGHDPQEPRLEHVFVRRDSKAVLDMGLKTHKWREKHWSWAGK